MKNNKFTLTKKTVCIVTVVAILLCIALILVPKKIFRADTTIGNVYTLSDTSVEFLRSVDEEVNIYIVKPDGTNYKFEKFVEGFGEINSNIRVETVYEDDVEFFEKLSISADTLDSYSVVVESEKRNTYITLDSLFLYSNSEIGFERISAKDYDTYYRTYATYASGSEQYAELFETFLRETVQYFIGDAAICEAVEYVCADVIYRPYLLTGHGENDFSQSHLTGISSGYPSLDIDTLGYIPVDASTIVINAPGEDISSAEAEMLIDFVNGGGLLTFITNDENLKMTNLCSVLSEYGMSAKEGVLVVDKDEKADVEDTENGEGENEAGDDTDNKDEPKVEYSFGVNVNAEHDITEFAFGGEYLFTANKANSIVLDSDKRDDLILTELLLTTSDAYIENESESRGKHTIAAAAEISSGGRVVWLTGAEAYNIGLETTESVSNAYLMFLGIHWTDKNYASSLGDIPMSIYELPPIIVDGKDQTVATFIMMFAIPATALGLGAAVLYKRKKESKITL